MFSPPPWLLLGQITTRSISFFCLTKRADPRLKSLPTQLFQTRQQHNNPVRKWLCNLIQYTHDRRKDKKKTTKSRVKRGIKPSAAMVRTEAALLTIITFYFSPLSFFPFEQWADDDDDDWIWRRRRWKRSVSRTKRERKQRWRVLNSYFLSVFFSLRIGRLPNYRFGLVLEIEEEKK